MFTYLKEKARTIHGPLPLLEYTIFIAVTPLLDLRARNSGTSPGFSTHSVFSTILLGTEEPGVLFGISKPEIYHNGMHLGCDFGDKGGEIVVVGTPETVAEHPTSHTGRYLKRVLEQHPPEVLAGWEVV